MKHSIELNTVEAMVVLNKLRDIRTENKVDEMIADRVKDRIINVVTNDLTNEEKRE